MAIAPIGLRLPGELKSKLRIRAKENHRSMNSEIVAILERAIASQAFWAAEREELFREIEALEAGSDA